MTEHAASRRVASRKARLRKALDDLAGLRLCGPSDDPDEQTSVIEGYRYILIQVKALSKGLVASDLTEQLDAVPANIESLFDVYESKAHLDAIAPDIALEMDDPGDGPATKELPRAADAPASPRAIVAAAERINATPQSEPLVFVSYSWDGPAHKEWVAKFATRLQQDGVHVMLDRWHLPRGGDKAAFMEGSVVGSDFVVLVCTPAYATRANERKGGVGYEAMVITGELAEKIDGKKFIPVLRAGEFESALPSWIKTKFGVDLRGDPYREDEYEDLLRTLHREPTDAPPVGPRPKWPRNSPEPSAPPSGTRRIAASPEDGSKADGTYNRESFLPATQESLTLTIQSGSDQGFLVLTENESDQQFSITGAAAELNTSSLGRIHRPAGNQPWVVPARGRLVIRWADDIRLVSRLCELKGQYQGSFTDFMDFIFHCTVDGKHATFRKKIKVQVDAPNRRLTQV